MGAALAVSLVWPSGPEEFRLWGEVLIAWVLATYVVAGNSPIIDNVGAHPARAPKRAWKRYAWIRFVVLLSFLLLSLRPSTLATWTLILVLPILSILLPFARDYLAERNLPWGAELEIGTNALVLFLSASLLGNAPGIARGLVDLPVSSAHLAAVYLTAACLGFLTRGGTHVVRGILARTDAGPLEKGPPTPASPVTPVDVAEYSRGRVIGAIERLIMAVMVAVGAFGALTFLIGAKGLIRSKRLEDHAFGEYFLIGTLSSTALAIACGFLLRAVFAALW
jgi:hypothetical protein